MRPDTLPESSSGRNNPERISNTEMIIENLALIRKAIEMIGQIIREYQSKLNLNNQQIEEIKTSLRLLSSYASQEIHSSRITINEETITSEVQRRVIESYNRHYSQKAINIEEIDPQLRLKILLNYITELLAEALTYAGNLYKTRWADRLIENLRGYKNKIDSIYKSLRVSK
jgi:hypothetical protein